MLGVGQNLPGVNQRLLGLMTDARNLEMLVEGVHGPQVGALHALKALQRHQKGLEALGFYQGFARQIEQAVQALGRDSQYPLTAFGQTLGTANRIGRRLRLGLRFRHWLKQWRRGSRRRCQQQLRHVKFCWCNPCTGG